MGQLLNSLQGLRAVSIILVIIFHLFPKILANGFAGVDMFFVLSGYLMTRILSKRITVDSIKTFYQKRFNRIVPLYYLTIFSTIIGVLCLVLQTERADFIYDLNWSLPLVSNMQPIFEHHSYWEQVSSIRYLTHLWSLCTELQYYLMAPAIQLIASNLPFNWRMLAYSTAIVILCSFQILTPLEYSYCFLASRVWQFLIGSVVFEFSKLEVVEDNKNREKWDLAYLFPLFFSTVLTIVMVFPIGETFARLTMTLMAALFILFCKKLEKSIFTLSPLIFIGNISYVLYLVHWPIINFVRYIQRRDATGLTCTEALTTTVIIFIVAILVHLYIERKLIKLETTFNFAITVFLIALSYSSIFWLQRLQCFSMKTLPIEVKNQAMFNLDDKNLLVNVSDLNCDVTKEMANLSISLAGIEYCSHKSDGNGTMLVIGNSLSIRAFPTIFKLLDGRYKELRLFAKHGSAPLLNVFEYYTNATIEMTEELKPDALWVIQGVNEIVFPLPNETSRFTSKVLDEVVPAKMDALKVNAGLVFVDLPYFLPVFYPAKLLARSLIYRKNLEEILSFSLEEVEDQIGDQTERLTNLNCSNCYFNDIQRALTNGQDRFYLYERDTYKVLNYDGGHLTLAAYEYIKPLYTTRINQFLDFVREK